MPHAKNKSCLVFHRVVNLIVVFCLVLSNIGPGVVDAQGLPDLPAAGTLVSLSEALQPLMLTGMIVHQEDPFRFEFIVQTGDEKLSLESAQAEALRLIKYFMAALTVPEEEMWVNLSPYEQDRIIPAGFGTTAMGRDLLAQDYMLKQLTASLLSPENPLGSDFWQRIYRRAYDEYGTTEVPMNTFNKVWIVPDRAEVVQSDGRVLVTGSRLKVLLEEDYLALAANAGRGTHGLGEIAPEDLRPLSELSRQVIREVIIPEIEREVNEGRTFARLRQISGAAILAAWYKQNIRQGILRHAYVNRNKTRGIDESGPEDQDAVYHRYLAAFEKGVCNLIREEYDPTRKEVVPRRYFSGGVKQDWEGRVVSSAADFGDITAGGVLVDLRMEIPEKTAAETLTSSPVSRNPAKVEDLERQASALVPLDRDYNQSRPLMRMLYAWAGTVLGGLAAMILTRDLVFVGVGAGIGAAAAAGLYNQLFPPSRYPLIEEGMGRLAEAKTVDELVAVRDFFEEILAAEDLREEEFLALTGVAAANELLRRQALRAGDLGVPEPAAGQYQTAAGQPFRALYRISPKSDHLKTMGVAYSYLKFGESRFIESFSAQLFDLIEAELREDIRHDPDQWVLVNPAGTNIPNAAFLLAKELSARLDLPWVSLAAPLGQSRSLQNRFASTTRNQEWVVTVNEAWGLADDFSFRGKKVIFIDDGVLTGTIMESDAGYLKDAGAARVEPFVVAKLDGRGDDGFEKVVDLQILRQFGIDPLVDTLNDEQALYTTRTINYSFQLQGYEFHQMLRHLTLMARMNLYLYAIEYFGARAPEGLDWIAELIEAEVGVRCPRAGDFQRIQEEAFFGRVVDLIKRYDMRVPVEEFSAVISEIWREMEMALPGISDRERRTVVEGQGKQVIAEREFAGGKGVPVSSPGGIDLNPGLWGLGDDGDPVVFPAEMMGPAGVEIDGLVPVIIHMGPVINAPALLDLGQGRKGVGEELAVLE